MKYLRKTERHERILAELRTAPAIRVSELARKFEVSDETIRRDLDQLGSGGLLNRTYGGASITPIGVEPALNERYHLLVEERTRIARRAAQLVNPGEVLMIDAGSTTTYFAQQLAAGFSDLTVITNNLAATTALAASPGIRIVLCPGDYDAREGGVFGPETNAFLQRFLADQCFIGASGLGSAGPTEANSGSAWVKRVMIAQSHRRTLLIDQSKYGRSRLEIVCPPGDLHALVADDAPAGALLRNLRKTGVEIYAA